jgi:hypothetical protein
MDPPDGPSALGQTRNWRLSGAKIRAARGPGLAAGGGVWSVSCPSLGQPAGHRLVRPGYHQHGAGREAPKPALPREAVARGPARRGVLPVSPPPGGPPGGQGPRGSARYGRLGGRRSGGRGGPRPPQPARRHAAPGPP